MTQKLNTSSSRSFTILCVLCRFDQIEDTIAKYEKDNYVIQPCSKSRTISVNTQQVYILTFELFNAKLMSKLKQLPLQYKDSHDSFQTITVEATGKDHSPHGNVFLLKRKVSEAKRKDVAFGEHLAVLVPVIFDVGNLSERPGTLQLDVSLDVILRTRLGLLYLKSLSTVQYQDDVNELPLCCCIIKPYCVIMHLHSASYAFCFVFFNLK